MKAKERRRNKMQITKNVSEPNPLLRKQRPRGGGCSVYFQEAYLKADEEKEKPRNADTRMKDEGFICNRGDETQGQTQ